MNLAHRGVIHFLRRVGDDGKAKRLDGGRWRRRRLRPANRNQRECDFAFGVQVQQSVHLRVNKSGDNTRGQTHGSRDRERVGENRAIVPCVTPIRRCTNDDDRGVGQGRIVACGSDESLSIISRSKLAQAKLGGPEVINPGGQCGRTPGKLNFRSEIGADHIKFDFVQRPRAGCGTKKRFSLRMFPAPCYPGREKQQLSKGFEVRDGFALWLDAGCRDR